MCIFVQEVETVLIDSNNTGGVEGGGAAAVDVEERGAEHGERTDQPCTRKHTEFNKSENRLSSLFFELDKNKFFIKAAPHRFYTSG